MLWGINLLTGSMPSMREFFLLISLVIRIKLSNINLGVRAGFAVVLLHIWGKIFQRFPFISFQNIATGKTSQDITSFTISNFFGYYHRVGEEGIIDN